MISTEIPFDPSTIRQLQESRILVLGSEVTDAAANDLCAREYGVIDRMITPPQELRG